MNTDKYLEQDFRDVHSPFEMDRRDFLKKMGGGLIITFSLKDFPLLSELELLQQQELDLNSYLRIRKDGRITLFTGKIEMGQGVITSLALMLADELYVRPEKIDMVMGDTDLCPWDMGTFGSRTTRFFGPLLRYAGAEARNILLQMASEYLSVPVHTLKTENGLISSSENKKHSISYAELTKGQIIVKKLDTKPKLKKSSDLKYIGKPYLRRDSLEKVTGEAQYAGDIHLPGMLFARLLRPPSHFSKLVRIDTSEAEKIKGVKLINDGSELIAVLHASMDIAELALSKIKAEFETTDPPVNDKNIFDHLMNSVTTHSVVDQGGDLKTGRKLSEQIFKKSYLDGYKAHATIENHTATAFFENGIMKIWASTQTPFRLKSNLAKLLEMSEDKVHVMQVFVGGGFGGKSSNREAHEAARLALLVNKPVQVNWTRGEEFFYDHFRPAAVVKITSGISSSGKISLWDYDVLYAGQRGSAQFYDIPHHKTISSGNGRREPSAHPFDTGAWRAPGNNTNTFARESQIELMAASAGVDPFEFRLKHLNKDPKMKDVLEKAGDKFGWIPAKGPSGRGYGIACGKDAGTDVVVMVEVKVNKKTGHVQVKRAVCAQNMGQVVNPQGAIIQVEGCIIMGLGYALSEDIKFNGGTILTRNFDTYEFTHFSWTPQIDVVLIDAQDEPPQGGGEPAIICMGGAIGNAIFDATGARLFQLPMTPERILFAIKETQNNR